MQIMKQICIPSAKNKNEPHCQCKKPERICIAYEKIKKNLHWNAKNRKGLHPQFLIA